MRGRRVAPALLEHGVDGATLLMLDGESLAELGVASSLQRARLLGAIKQLRKSAQK